MDAELEPSRAALWSALAGALTWLFMGCVGLSGSSDCCHPAQPDAGGDAAFPAPDASVGDAGWDAGATRVVSYPGVNAVSDVRVEVRSQHRDSTGVRLEDFLLHKQREFDGWTLHVYSSNHVRVTGVRIFSGNDGTDPDSSTDVTYDGVYIESQDDAVAVKTRGNAPVEGLTVKNCFAKSAASALKVGENTVKRRVSGVTFSDCTVYDSDRALVVTPACDGSNDSDCQGSIGTVLYRNIRVPWMRKNKVGRTLLVSGAGSYWAGSSIVFDGLDATLIEPASLATSTEVKNSRLTATRSMTLFEGTCPTRTNVAVTWLAGTAPERAASRTDGPARTTRPAAGSGQLGYRVLAPSHSTRSRPPAFAR